MSEKIEKGHLFQLKNRETGLFFGGNIRDLDVVFFHSDKLESKTSLNCSRRGQQPNFTAFISTALKQVLNFSKILIYPCYQALPFKLTSFSMDMKI